LTGANNSVNLVQSNVDSFASYANTTFSTGNVDAFASYANATFATGNLNQVESNAVAYATYANSTFLTTTAANVANSNFPIDASTNTFTLTQTVSNVNNMLVIIDGLVQSPDAYTVSGTTLTLSNSAPLPSGINVDVRYLQFVFPGTIDGGAI
jgi:hypothetical protein